MIEGDKTGNNFPFYIACCDGVIRLPDDDDHLGWIMGNVAAIKQGRNSFTNSPSGVQSHLTGVSGTEQVIRPAHSPEELLILHKCLPD
ncbi:hypothetical Protein YC6258_04747 [Gynuella sunshinyii YC6258]|uniref:Uncharacterized protein n=1 Tax=Gynuella sunshinyii YC6258 TaxID=1445510 RepID=A0A0C5W292_9GAMM|nr:hypothetical Protein YC6258_04747 [Gynuella sunshinyii YC6258]